jgi:hypothetical protein
MTEVPRSQTNASSSPDHGLYRSSHRSELLTLPPTGALDRRQKIGGIDPFDAFDNTLS